MVVVSCRLCLWVLKLQGGGRRRFQTHLTFVAFSFVLYDCRGNSSFVWPNCINICVFSDKPVFVQPWPETAWLSEGTPSKVLPAKSHHACNSSPLCDRYSGLFLCSVVQCLSLQSDFLFQICSCLVVGYGFSNFSI